MDHMARITEIKFTGAVTEPEKLPLWKSFASIILQEIPRSIVPLIISLVILVFGWVTPLGPILTVLSEPWQSSFSPGTHTDLIPARILLPFKKRFGFLMKYDSFSSWFRTPFPGPILNIVFLSFAPVGATLYYLEKQGAEEKRRQKENLTKGGNTVNELVPVGNHKRDWGVSPLIGQKVLRISCRHDRRPGEKLIDVSSSDDVAGIVLTGAARLSVRAPTWKWLYTCGLTPGAALHSAGRRIPSGDRRNSPECQAGGRCCKRLGGRRRFFHGPRFAISGDGKVSDFQTGVHEQRAERRRGGGTTPFRDWSAWQRPWRSLPLIAHPCRAGTDLGLVTEVVEEGRAVNRAMAMIQEITKRPLSSFWLQKKLLT